MRNNILTQGKYLLFVYLLFNACSTKYRVDLSDKTCNYSVNGNSLKSNCAIYQGFFFALIHVDSFDVKGIPTKFIEDTTILCAPKGISEESKYEDSTLGKENKDTMRFIPQTQIYFDRINKYYEWVYIKPRVSDPIYEICPLKFERNKWYHLRALVSQGTARYFIFFLVSDSGEIKQFNVFQPGAF